jgi:hypothetical protein
MSRSKSIPVTEQEPQPPIAAFIHYRSREVEAAPFYVVVGLHRWPGSRNDSDMYVHWTVPTEDAELFELSPHFLSQRIIVA